MPWRRSALGRWSAEQTADTYRRELGKTVLNVSRFRVHDAAIANPGTDHARTVRIKRLALGDTALKPYPKDAEHEAVYLVR